jgi:hypothetical protein
LSPLIVARINELAAPGWLKASQHPERVGVVGFASGQNL